MTHQVDNGEKRVLSCPIACDILKIASYLCNTLMQWCIMMMIRKIRGGYCVRNPESAPPASK